MKKRYLYLGMAFAAILIAGLLIANPSLSATKKGTPIIQSKAKYEYTVVEVRKQYVGYDVLPEQIKEINNMANKGWRFIEVCAIPQPESYGGGLDRIFLYFERIIKE